MWDGLLPTQNPASTIFSEYMQMAGGRLSMAKLTGQRLLVEDLNSGMPSVEIIKEIVLLLPLSKFALFMDNPSHTSLMTWSVLLEVYCKRSQFLSIMADKGFASEISSR